MKKQKSKNPASKRDYKKEYARDQKKRSGYRSDLNKKNQASFARGDTHVGDGLDQAHVDDVRKGGSKSGKTVPRKVKRNRSWRSGQSGYG